MTTGFRGPITGEGKRRTPWLTSGPEEYLKVLRDHLEENQEPTSGYSEKGGSLEFGLASRADVMSIRDVLLPKLEEIENQLRSVNDGDHSSPYEEGDLLRPVKGETKQTIPVKTLISFSAASVCVGVFVGGGILTFLVEGIWPVWFWISLAISASGVAGSEWIEIRSSGA